VGWRSGFSGGGNLDLASEKAGMKPINPWPLIAMLVLVVFLYLWLNGYLV